MNAAIAEIQRMLINGGFSVGKGGADGLYGPATKSALQKCIAQATSGKNEGGTLKLTQAQLDKIFPVGASSGRNAKFLGALNDLFEKTNINTVNRIAGFLSQIGVESAEFRYVRELGNNSYFDKYDTGPIAERLGNTPQKDGDGAKYKGRGLIQITGLANYKACGKALGLDLVNHPELLEQPEYAVASAGWYWNMRNINAACDADDIVKITKLVNGGTNHLAERTAYYKKAKSVLTS
uniref:Endolysin n=2 Tax=unclassified Seunavirus TaxID=2494210 RepID=A0AAU8GHX4_9CAUD